jgi:hypothetical protein
MDEYQRRIEEWHEKVDPAVLRELNRRRVAKGHTRIRSPRRPATGYARYVYNTHIVVAVLSKVLGFSCTYERSTQRRKTILKLVSRLRLSAPRVNGGQ